ncbi:MAG: sulfotransferase family protein [Gemmatimonadaceae bacterium]
MSDRTAQTLAAQATQVLPVPAINVCERARWAFLVGAPRCGTTSFSRYLADHEDVCFSDPKETHFFAMSDMRSLSDDELQLKIERDYLARFFPERGHSPVMAEGSVTYLFVPEHLDAIVRLWPDAQFIIGVRNPLTMVPSLHQRLCYIGDETERDFAHAWALVPERREGRSIPRSCAVPRWLDYWDAGMLGKYVSQFIDRFGRDRCFVYIFDDFVSDPASVYRDVLKFLGLPDDARHDYPTHRDGRDYKIGWLQRTVMGPPRGLLMLAGVGYRRVLATGPEKKLGVVGRAALAAREKILAWNMAPAPRVHIEQELRSEMIAMFRDDVARLGELLDRDLSHWLDG